MDFLKEFFQYILNLGPSVFLALILTIIGIILRMRITRAVSAGLLLGVGLAGMSLVVNYMVTNVGSAAQAFVGRTGVHLANLDMGWPPALGLAWAWKFAFLMFPIQIVVNIVMLAFRWTECLNVDMWNVGNKVLTAFLVYYVSHQVWLGFLVAAFQAVVELKNADFTKNRLQSLTGIPGISLPHPMFLSGIWFYPITHLMDKIIPQSWSVDAAKLRSKVGVFGENHIMGFIIGCLIGAVGGYGVTKTLTLGIQAAVALTLFPLIAKLFTASLTPISEAATEFTKRRFHDRTLTIGLDWPVMAGRSEHWLVMVLAIPLILLYALILPGNSVMPFGGLMDICLVVPLFYLTRGNFVKMAIGTILLIPMQLYVASYFAPFFTSLAQTTGGVNTPPGQGLAWFGMDISELRYMFVAAANGQIAGIILVILTIPLAFYYFRNIRREDEQIRRELAGDAQPN